MTVPKKKKVANFVATFSHNNTFYQAVGNGKTKTDCGCPQLLIIITAITYNKPACIRLR